MARGQIVASYYIYVCVAGDIMMYSTWLIDYTDSYIATYVHIAKLQCMLIFSITYTISCYAGKSTIQLYNYQVSVHKYMHAGA